MTLLALPIICFSFFTQAAFGFGGGMIAISLLSLFLSSKDAVVVVMFFQFLVGLLILKLWREIDRQTVIELAPGLLIGTIAGFFLFSYVNERIVDALLATYILFYLANERGYVKIPFASNFEVPDHIHAHFRAVIGGLIQGMTGTGGPTVIPYIKNKASSKVSFRATLLCLFFALNGVRILLTGVPHFANPALLKVMLWTVPFFIVSIFTGYHTAQKIHPKHFDMAIFVLLFASAISLAYKSITMS